MWTRSELKRNAKKSLTGSYWMALLVTIITGLLAGNSSIFSYNINDRDVNHFAGMNFAWSEWATLFNNFWVRLILAAISMAILIAILFRIFFSTVIEVGASRWFSRNREAKPTPSLGQMFSLFRSNTWLPTVGAMVWMYIWLWLWSLLPFLAFAGGAVLIGIYLGLFNPLQIPAGWWAFGQGWARPWTWRSNPGQFQDWQNQLGEFFANNQTQIAIIVGVFVGAMLLSILLSIPYINRVYAYRQTRWILADNPRIGFRRALRLSRQMMKGHKFDTFVLDLSFIGWFFLGFIALIIGIIFVFPYYRATQAELYAVLRRNAVDQGLATMADFGFISAGQPSESPAAEIQAAPSELSETSETDLAEPTSEAPSENAPNQSDETSDSNEKDEPTESEER